MYPATFKLFFHRHFPEPRLTALSPSTTGLCPHPRSHPSHCAHPGHFRRLVIIDSTRPHVFPAASPVLPQVWPAQRRSRRGKIPRALIQPTVSAAADYGFLGYLNFRNGALWILDGESKVKARGPLAAVVHSRRESLGLRKMDSINEPKQKVIF